MPYIRSIEGALYEFDNDDNRLGRLQALALNSYSYLQRRLWSATGTGITNPVTNPDYTDDFPFLAAHGFRYIQIMAAPFGAVEWKTYVGEPDLSHVNLGIKASYFAAVNAILEEAKAYGLGLLLCPFWNPMMVPSLFDEAQTAILDANSKTRQYIRAFAARFAQEFAGHDGVAGWTVTEEILNALAFHGTPRLFAQAGQVVKEMAQAVRSKDATRRRIIMAANNGILRPESAGDKITLDDYVATILPVINPDPVDTISETLFVGNQFLSSTTPPDYTTQSLAYLRVMQAAASRLGKPYVVSSFGVSIPQESNLGDTSQRNLLTFIANMAQAGVQLAVHWVWNAGAPEDISEDLEDFNVLVTGNAPSTFVRPDVFGALKQGQTLMRVWPAQPLIREPIRPRFGSVAHFRVTALQGSLFTVTNNAVNTAEFSISYTMRQTSRSSLANQRFLGKRPVSGGATTGWVVAIDGGKSYFQLWNGTGVDGSLSTRMSDNDAPLDELGEWVRVTWTASATGVTCLYVNDFLWARHPGTGVYSAGTDPFVVGRLAGAAGETVEWDLSDVILYDRQLTPREVFEYGQYGTVINPLGRWTLDGNLLDSGPRGLDGVQYTPQGGSAVALPSFVEAV